MLILKDITVQYENLIAVKNVSLNLDKGKIHGLVGPNGAGKSTLINVCIGLINEYEGSIVYGDKELVNNRQWVKDNVGYAPEDTQLMPYLTAGEFLELIRTVKTNTSELLEIDPFINMLDLGSKLDELVIELSHGMRQKLLLASAFLGEPQYLIIDEALNGLDPIALHNVRKYLKEQAGKGVTVLISSHVLPLIRDWSDTINLMHGGKIIRQFTPLELDELETKNKQSFSDIFLDLVQESKT